MIQIVSALREKIYSHKVAFSADRCDLNSDLLVVGAGQINNTPPVLIL